MQRMVRNADSNIKIKKKMSVLGVALFFAPLFLLFHLIAPSFLSSFLPICVTYLSLFSSGFHHHVEAIS